MASTKNVEQTTTLFSSAVEKILNPNTPGQRNKSNALFSYILRLIIQFNLFCIDVEEVINESYLRGIKYIDKTGEEIYLPEAFIKRTSLNVVREMSRKKKTVSDYRL